MKPGPRHTHKITLPGSTFAAYVNAEVIDPATLAAKVAKASDRKAPAPVVEKIK